MSSTNRRSFLARSAALAAVPAVAFTTMYTQLGVLPGFASAVAASAP